MGTQRGMVDERSARHPDSLHPVSDDTKPVSLNAKQGRSQITSNAAVARRLDMFNSLANLAASSPDWEAMVASDWGCIAPYAWVSLGNVPLRVRVRSRWGTVM